MKTVCPVCTHHCHLEPGQRGLCGARKNEDGKIVCENYGQVTSLALDPIEKKPLKRFRPGSLVLSVGSFGCNLRCPFCQNHEISMLSADETAGEDSGTADENGETGKIELIDIPPQALAGKALQCRPFGNIGVAFTYNEPLVGWEYVRDTAKLVKDIGMENILVTNGTASLKVLEELLPFIDAMNIDLKGFRESYYRKLGGDLEMVKRFISRAAKDCHVELTTLIVPGENDCIEEMEEEARWIASLDAQIPLHVTRFFPRYQMMDREATEMEAVYQLADVARRYLTDVFVGNC